MDKYIVKTYWRMGIRDAKRWDHWTWSPEYETFEACLAAYQYWIKANPRRVISFTTRQAYVPVEAAQ